MDANVKCRYMACPPQTRPKSEPQNSDERAIVMRNAWLAERMCLGNITIEEVREYKDLQAKLDPVLLKILLG
jgi:hypothetical protein